MVCSAWSSCCLVPGVVRALVLCPGGFKAELNQYTMPNMLRVPVVYPEKIFLVELHQAIHSCLETCKASSPPTQSHCWLRRIDGKLCLIFGTKKVSKKALKTNATRPVLGHPLDTEKGWPFHVVQDREFICAVIGMILLHKLLFFPKGGDPWPLHRLVHTTIHLLQYRFQYKQSMPGMSKQKTKGQNNNITSSTYALLILLSGSQSYRLEITRATISRRLHPKFIAAAAPHTEVITTYGSSEWWKHG